MIRKKMKNVLEKVGFIEKDGEVKYHSTRYKYLSEEAIVAEIHEAFAEEGVIVYPHANTLKFHKPAGKGYLTMIKTTWHFADPDDPDEAPIVVQTFGAGLDGGDKGVYKAMTGSFKYALRQSFVIATGDDPDDKSSEELNDEIKNPVMVYYKKLKKEGYDHDTIRDIFKKLFDTVEPEQEQVEKELTEITTAKKKHLDKIKKLIKK